MECEYCKKVLKTQSSLTLHQKTTKYCLAKQNKVPEQEFSCFACNVGFTLKSSLHSHLKICKENTPEKELRREYERREKELIYNFEKKLQEKDKVISDQKIIIKELQSEYKKQMEMQNKDLQDRIQSMVEKAIDKPSSVQNTTNQINHIINNLLPITTEHLDDQVQYLTIDHVKHGAVGYAKYALEHPLKDRLVCTDTSRKKGKYKDSDGNLVSDPEMASITKKLFFAIYERNGRLVTEYANDLKAKIDSFNSSSNNEMTEQEASIHIGMTDDLIDLITSAFSQKRQSNEISEGLKPDLFHQFVKELATGSYRSN